MSAFASGLRGTRYGQVFSLYTYNSNFRKLRTKVGSREAGHGWGKRLLCHEMST
jgi:hypothetical protein